MAGRAHRVLGAARIGFVLVALAPAVALGIPAQWLALRFGFGWRRHLPVWFHRYVSRVFRVRVHQSGRPATGRPLLIVANHLSWLDICVISTALPVSFIAKAEVAGWPLFGLFARLQRSVFVDRERRSRTGAVNAEIAERLQAGDPMVLFAEGTTGDGNRILSFRSALVGAVDAAMRGEGAPVTVQALAVTYHRRGGLPLTRVERPAVAWYGDMDLLPHLAGVLRGAPLDVQLGWGEPRTLGRSADRKRLVRDLENEVRLLDIAAKTGRMPPAPPLAISPRRESD